MKRAILVLTVLGGLSLPASAATLSVAAGSLRIGGHTGIASNSTPQYSQVRPISPATTFQDNAQTATNSENGVDFTVESLVQTTISDSSIVLDGFAKGSATGPVQLSPSTDVSAVSSRGQLTVTVDEPTLVNFGASISRNETGPGIDFSVVQISLKASAGPLNIVTDGPAVNQQLLLLPNVSYSLSAIALVDVDGEFTADNRFAASLTVVPEPASLSLLALGGGALLRRRR